MNLNENTTVLFTSFPALPSLLQEVFTDDKEA
jgi:hypothetical protein